MFTNVAQQNIYRIRTWPEHFEHPTQTSRYTL
jgi:hypothetical protein